jgi:hypothetical protein
LGIPWWKEYRWKSRSQGIILESSALCIVPRCSKRSNIKYTVSEIVEQATKVHIELLTILEIKTERIRDDIITVKRNRHQSAGYSHCGTEEHCCDEENLLSAAL